MNSADLYRHTNAPAGKCAIWTTHAAYFNDNPWPYAADSTPAGPPYGTGATAYTVGDSPRNKLAGSSQVTSDSLYRMYIMFLPAPDPPGAVASAWVPLRSVDWGASWCVQVQADGKWKVFPGTIAAHPWVANSAVPQWDKDYDSVVEETIDCPADCS